MPTTGEEIRNRGLAALKKALGTAGLVRFIQHLENGKGDCTRDRSKLLKDLTMADLRDHVRNGRKQRAT